MGGEKRSSSGMKKVLNPYAGGKNRAEKEISNFGGGFGREGEVWKKKINKREEKEWEKGEIKPKKGARFFLRESRGEKTQNRGDKTGKKKKK